jgi:DSF synthase
MNAHDSGDLLTTDTRPGDLPQPVVPVFRPAAPPQPPLPAAQRAGAGGGIAAMLSRPYKTVRLEWTSSLGLLRVRTCVKPIQCYSLAAMSELQQVLDDVDANPGLVRHIVMSSDVPQVFNFGGDLALFILLARAGDIDSLKLYGRLCVDLVWWLENAAERGVHTTVLVQGDTLGGGLESVLPFHKVVFERSAQAGFPEVVFNLFPGMGAWEFTIRKAGFAVANEMILSGRVFSAEDLLARRLVDIVVDDGKGEAAVDRVVREADGRLRGILAALRARRIAAPISYDTLQAIVDRWAEAALQLTDRDLRLMDRLARAQAQKAGGAAEGAIEEIKRLELESVWGERRTGQDRRHGGDRRGGA